jgi:hypothetical protein
MQADDREATGREGRGKSGAGQARAALRPPRFSPSVRSLVNSGGRASSRRAMAASGYSKR